MDNRYQHLWGFHGGLSLAGHKAESTHHRVRKAGIPPLLTLPLHQHIGESAVLLVEVGEKVRKGQPLATANGYVSSPVHAPSSGTVVDIGEHRVAHPSGLAAPCLVIETDGRDEWLQRPAPVEDFTRLEPYRLRSRIREAGIVGMGGAGFPAAVKLNPGRDRAIKLLILNGVECEPYISCDDMLMRERPQEVLEGARILSHVLQVRECVIAIEDNKPEAIMAIRQTLERPGHPNPNLHVVEVPTRYPSGGERQLIRILTGREVPSQGLPADIGIVCHNVATSAAVYRAIVHHEPMLSRIITVTGDGIREPANIEALIGTPVSALAEQCGGYRDEVERVIIGGPMMGFTLGSDTVPVVKTTNCILAVTRRTMPEPLPAQPCIRCGECADVCPANLLPQQLYWYAHARDFDAIQDYSLFDCIECGCCAFVCPSKIPLVHYYRYAKTEIWAQELERQKSDIARRRHESRIQRLERIKQERSQRMAQKKRVLARDSAAVEDPKKAAIEAALARVKAKKAGGGATPRNVENLTEEQQEKIRQVDARRRHARSRTANSGE
jgi:electron transport complex protein RnfC